MSLKRRPTCIFSTSSFGSAWYGASSRRSRSAEILESKSARRVRAPPVEHTGACSGGGVRRKVSGLRKLGPVPGVRYAGEFPDSGNSGRFRGEGTGRRMFRRGGTNPSHRFAFQESWRPRNTGRRTNRSGPSASCSPRLQKFWFRCKGHIWATPANLILGVQDQAMLDTCVAI